MQQRTKDTLIEWAVMVVLMAGLAYLLASLGCTTTPRGPGQTPTATSAPAVTTGDAATVTVDSRTDQTSIQRVDHALDSEWAGILTKSLRLVAQGLGLMLSILVGVWLFAYLSPSAIRNPFWRGVGFGVAFTLIVTPIALLVGAYLR